MSAAIFQYLAAKCNAVEALFYFHGVFVLSGAVKRQAHWRAIDTLVLGAC
ncbi:MAG: hypothetical protein JKX92_05070 [Porticoccaceae bacterium]|nr:hypothetical protein [Porticoccaceae bacterium]